MKNSLNIGEAFGFVFKEENWVSKVFVGGLVVIASILLLPIPFLAWYQIATFRNVLGGKRPFLPKWSFSKTNYILGLKVLAVGLGYSIPSIVLNYAGGGIFALLRALYSLLVIGIMPFALGKLAETEDIGAAFNIKWIWEKITHNISSVVVLVIGVFLAGLAAMLGLIGLIIGIVFTVFWASQVEMYLSASLYKLAKK